MVERAGFDVMQAETGEEALRLAAQHPILIILLDLHLPDIDGFEVCRRLRAAPATRDIRICAMTGVYTGSEDKHEALAAGADGLLRKPVDPDDLKATLDALLRTPARAHRIT